MDIEDLKRCNQLLNQHFSEDELEGLLELAGKSDGKITFENFTEFLNNEKNFLVAIEELSKSIVRKFDSVGKNIESKLDYIGTKIGSELNTILKPSLDSMNQTLENANYVLKNTI